MAYTVKPTKGRSTPPQINEVVTVDKVASGVSRPAATHMNLQNTDIGIVTIISGEARRRIGT
jgi:hypothetical protein